MFVALALFFITIDDAPNGVLHSRENFKGCIRNLVIGERARDWIDMHKLVRIQLNSCEIP